MGEGSQQWEGPGHVGSRWLLPGRVWSPPWPPLPGTTDGPSLPTCRYNDFLHDPLSLCKACDPQPNAENAISARSDLNPANGSYPFHALQQRSHGGIDVKVPPRPGAPGRLVHRRHWGEDGGEGWGQHRRQGKSRVRVRLWLGSKSGWAPGHPGWGSLEPSRAVAQQSALPRLPGDRHGAGQGVALSGSQWPHVGPAAPFPVEHLPLQKPAAHGPARPLEVLAHRGLLGLRRHLWPAAFCICSPSRTVLQRLP